MVSRVDFGTGERGTKPGTRSFTAIIANALLGIAIVALLGSAVLHFALRAKGYTFYQVVTPSMSPMISPGDVIATRVVEPHTIQQGDVIAFRQEGVPVPVVHRVIAIESSPDLKSIFQNEDGTVIGEKMSWAPRTFHTKGDANPTADSSPVLQQQFVGRYEFIVPGVLGFIATHLGGPAMLLLGFGIIGTGLMASVAEAVMKRGRQGAATRELTA